MGYDTKFDGAFRVSRNGWYGLHDCLLPKHRDYLIMFSYTRRMKRNPKIAEKLPDPIRLAVDLSIGLDGCYFVGSKGLYGQSMDESIIDFNASPAGQPELWCKWVPNDDGTLIEWNGGGNFYCHIEWINYLIYHFLIPWGYTLNGKVRWQGERIGDAGCIHMDDNAVTVVTNSL